MRSSTSYSLAIGAGVWACASWVSAHELEVDRLRLWPNPDWGVVRGQVTFDPKLTRDDEAPPPGDAKQRIVAFLERNLTVELNGDPCSPSIDVRELYEKGGAVPGDVAMLQCPVPSPMKTLRVVVGGEFPMLAVRVVGFDQTASSEEGVIVLGGQRSPTYSFPQADGSKTVTTSERQTTAQVLWSQVRLGFVHILPRGWDHVLFVLGLALGYGGRLRRLVLELSAFTAAHTCTLALGAAGMLVVPGSVIEPLIALSICCVALENLLRWGGARVRLALAFVFGLVHGQGFAGALAELGLAHDAFLTALLGFNVGVEIGQLVVVLLFLGGVWTARHAYEPNATLRDRAVRWASISIAAIGAYWAVERVIGA